MKTLKITIFSLLLAGGNLWAQQSVSINNRGIVPAQEQRSKSASGNVSRSRTFEVNPQLQNFSQSNIGDTLLLDFFGNKRYKAVVTQVLKSYDGITGITAQVANTEFGYCYITVSDNGIALSAEIPQEDAFFSIKKINGNISLTEQTLSEVQREDGGECSHASENTDAGAAHSPALRAVTPTLSESNAAVTVDILVVYTPAAKAWAVQNGIDINLDIVGGIQRANQVLSNSQTNVTLNLVYKQEVNYTESGNTNTDLDRLKSPGDGYVDEAHALRSRYNADLVVLLLGESNSNVAGAGYILGSEYGSPKNGFSAMKARHTNTTGYVLIHEIGHNFGCGHHTGTDNTSIYSYSHGYGGTSVSGGFSTIMTYENLNYGARIPYFSDPNILYNNVAVGSANANNAKTIRQTKGLIAGYSNEVPWYDAFLQNITLSDGALSPAFNPGVYQYTVEVPYSVASIDVQGIANSPHGANINGNVTAMLLNVGSNNKVEIEVEDNWGNYTKKYTVNITRAAPVVQSNDATLRNLTVDEGTLMPSFSANTTDYSVNVANSVSSITLSATASHHAANVTGAGSQSLSVGSNSFNIVCTAEDGTTETYTVTVNRYTSGGTTNIDEGGVEKITIYPNPAVNELRISNYAGGIVQITDLSGRTVLTDLCISPNSTINVSALPQGIYIIKAGAFKGKFVKK
jgi:hypothetical protein